MLSKVAYETKGKDWCRANIVGTGPFKQVEWKRDASLKWTKFDGYWQKGRPYLDAIEYRYVPDPVTASAMMQAKEADIWIYPPSLHQADLERKGLDKEALLGSPRDRPLFQHEGCKQADGQREGPGGHRVCHRQAGDRESLGIRLPHAPQNDPSKG